MTTGTGPLLRSGNIKDYAPLGEEGNPVYKWATQIRVAIKRKVDGESAQVFAIPQPNESGDVIDWYAPRAGFVIPWSSATPEEKKSAKDQLDVIKQQLDVAGDEFKHSENTEQSVFNRLLKHVLQFPSDEHVYLVNGKPVITFWGFVSTDATPRANPLAILVVPEPKKIVDAIPPTVISAVDAVPVKRRSFWWWLLPLLLLLLLLFFLLRGREETADIPLLEKLTSNKPELEKLIDDTEVETPADHAFIPVTRQQGDIGINLDNGGVISDTILTENLIDTEEALLESDLPSDLVQDVLEEELTLEEQDALHAALEPDDIALPDEKLIEPGQELPESIGQDQEQQDPMSNEQNKMPNKNTEPESLTIPDDPSQQNSMDFLDGRWQADSGLVDSKDMRPVNLEYEFKDGKGHARIKRSDGSICSGAVKAKRNGSEVTFSDQEIIKCQNGDVFQPAEVKCKINSDKQTICEGADSDGSFKMGIKKAPE